MNYDVEETSNQITNNVVERLRLALGIPNDKASQEKLKEFFYEKFTPPV